MPLVTLALLLPFGLLMLMLVMERVEGPLRDDATSDQLESFLAGARPEEVETFVSEGFAPALERYWRRRRRGRLLPGRPR
ncbi:MAG TPA: hypothetical protein VNA30_08095 [Mycobacteriales bacterium]|nr:hypothetical protein [Mycobacteriales bacterium]